MDFLIHAPGPGAYDGEARFLGAALHRCPDPRRPLRFARCLRSILRQAGPYDVVHSHVHRYSGWVLRAAEREMVPVRIAHAHTDDAEDEARAGFARSAYVRLMAHWIGRHATAGLAVSRPAAAALFGAGWERDRRIRILRCGIDLDLFRPDADRIRMRREMGIPDGTLVVGHVGSFRGEKNHGLLIAVAGELRSRRAPFRLVLAGDGPLRAGIERAVAEAGLTDHVRFLGLREDVPQLLMGLFDLFVFPSIREGLPLAVVEAQAAGLPVILSDAVTEEAVLTTGTVRRLSPRAGAPVWADAVLTAAAPRCPEDRADAIERIRASGFDIATSIAELRALYGAPDNRGAGCG